MDENCILIVEDDGIIAQDISMRIKKFGYCVAKICSDGESALSYIEEGNRVSLIFMDINLNSAMDGIEVATKIREFADIPIVYITAYCETDIIDRAIDTNPSGYIVKPFKESDILTAIKLAIKDQSDEKIGDIILDDDFSYDSRGKQLIYRGEFVSLTKKETQLLELLIERKNQIVPIEVIDYEIWPDSSPTQNTRRALIMRLRSKLENRFIETIISMGYRLNV